MEPGEFPPNSKKAKEPKEPKVPVEKPPVEQIVSGAVLRKKSLSRRFKEVFIAGDIKRARDYVWMDIIVPNIQDLIWGVIAKGSERVIYPESRRQAGRPGSGLFAPRIQFNQTVRRDPREVQGVYSGPPQQLTRGSARERHDIGELILGSREEAQLVVEQLIEYIDKYDVATVGDLYQLLGHEATFVNEQWGWTNLASVEIKHVSRGYLVELPEPEPIQR